MSDHRPEKKQNSYAKGLLFALLFVALYFLYTQLSRKGLPSQFAELLDTERAVAGIGAFYDSLGGEQFYGECEGFWVARYETASDSLGYVVEDRIEFKSNGIVWRVLTHRFLFGAQTISGVHTMDAYVRPFKRIDSVGNVAQCDVRVLRQARGFDSDTCFGPENSDVVWNCGIENEQFVFRGVRYTRYDGDLAQFFPDNAIGMLEQGYDRVGRASPQSGYEVRDKVITLRPDAKGAQFGVSLDMVKCSPESWFGAAAYARGVRQAQGVALLLEGLAWEALPEVELREGVSVAFSQGTGPKKEKIWQRSGSEEKTRDTLELMVSRYVPTLKGFVAPHTLVLWSPRSMPTQF